MVLYQLFPVGEEGLLPLQFSPRTVPTPMVYHNGVWTDPVSAIVSSHPLVNDFTSCRNPRRH